MVHSSKGRQQNSFRAFGSSLQPFISHVSYKAEQQKAKSMHWMLFLVSKILIVLFHSFLIYMEIKWEVIVKLIIPKSDLGKYSTTIYTQID